MAVVVVVVLCTVSFLRAAVVVVGFCIDEILQDKPSCGIREALVDRGR